MPYTWYAHGVSPAVDPPYTRDPSIRGVKGWGLREPPLRAQAAPQKPAKKVYSYRGENFTLGKDGLLEKV